MYAFDINGVNITHANPGLSEYVIPKEAKFIQDGNETSYVFKDVCQSGKSFSIPFKVDLKSKLVISALISSRFALFSFRLFR